MRLEVSEASVGYGAHTVLGGVGFALARGEIGCLLGPSAAGKTTLLRAIAGFEALQRGRIEADDETLAAPGVHVPPERRRIGMVFQDHALLPHLSAFDNVRFGLFAQSRRDAAARAMAMLELVGLAASAQRYPHELSGGQQQRIALARALAPQPRLVLLDEPFSSLDQDLRERLARDVRAALKQAGVGALLVTHSQPEAFAMSDVIGVIGEGRLQQWGTAQDLYQRPASRFVAGFIGDGVLLAARGIGDGRAQCALGELELRDARLGDALNVLVRPHDVVPDAAGTPAVVIERSFRGDVFVCTLRLDDGTQVQTLLPVRDAPAPGEPIRVRLAAHEPVAFG